MEAGTLVGIPHKLARLLEGPALSGPSHQDDTEVVPPAMRLNLRAMGWCQIAAAWARWMAEAR